MATFVTLSFELFWGPFRSFNLHQKWLKTPQDECNIPTVVSLSFELFWGPFKVVLGLKMPQNAEDECQNLRMSVLWNKTIVGGVMGQIMVQNARWCFDGVMGHIWDFFVESLQ